MIPNGDHAEKEAHYRSGIVRKNRGRRHPRSRRPR